MIRHTWDAVLDTVDALINVAESTIGIVYGFVADVRHVGDKVGNIVGGHEEYEEETIDGDDLAELIKSVRQDEKRRK